MDFSQFCMCNVRLIKNMLLIFFSLVENLLSCQFVEETTLQDSSASDAMTLLKSIRFVFVLSLHLGVAYKTVDGVMQRLAHSRTEEEFEKKCINELHRRPHQWAWTLHLRSLDKLGRVRCQRISCSMSTSACAFQTLQVWKNVLFLDTVKEWKTERIPAEALAAVKQVCQLYSTDEEDILQTCPPSVKVSFQWSEKTMQIWFSLKCLRCEGPMASLLCPQLWNVLSQH